MSIKNKDDITAHRHQHNNIELTDLKGRILHKKRSLQFFYLLVPYFLFLFISIKLLGLSSKKWNQKLSIWFIKHYYNLYFIFRGVNYYTNTDFKPIVENPSLIFTTRHNVYSSLHVYRQFKTPLIIPLNSMFYTTTLLPYIPWHIMRSLLKKISYPDQHITYNLAIIKTLLKTGYPVLVYLNESYTDESYNNTLYMGKEIFELLKLDVPTYFLRESGMNDYAKSTMFTPIIVSSSLKSKEDILEELDLTNEGHVASAICDFFMFRYANVVL